MDELADIGSFDFPCDLLLFPETKDVTIVKLKRAIEIFVKGGCTVREIF